MVETRSQNSAEGQKAMSEVEVHPDPAIDENREWYVPEGSGNRRLASESTPVEQDQDFVTSTGTLDREEMSELSDISTENVATTRSPLTTLWCMRWRRIRQRTPRFQKEWRTLWDFLSIYHGNGHRQWSRNPGRGGGRWRTRWLRISNKPQ